MRDIASDARFLYFADENMKYLKISLKNLVI